MHAKCKHLADLTRLTSENMASSTQQDLMACEQCNNHLEFFCNFCKISLCSSCTIAHLRDENTEGHLVVPYRDRMTISITKFQCKRHNETSCKVFCKTCSMPFCKDCYSFHEEHNISMLLEEIIDRGCDTLSKEQVMEKEERKNGNNFLKFEETQEENRRLHEHLNQLLTENKILQDENDRSRKKTLTDTNHPMKIVEKFGELYDETWTDALEEIFDNVDNEKKAIQVLLKILKKAYDFCVRTENNYEARIGQAVFTLTDENSREIRHITGADVPVQKALTDLRLSLSNACCLIVEEMFLTRLSPILKKVDLSISPTIKLYARQCASLCWQMRILDPPIFAQFGFRRGTYFNEDVSKYFTKYGRYVDFIVWPTLFLHENGPVLSKGVTQPI